MERDQERKHMVAEQLIPRGIKDPLVLEAMLTVPRHYFVPLELQKYAYDDNPLPIGEKQTISQPFIVALMTEFVRAHKDAKALEIGTGSGYAAAILAHICKSVVTIERLPQLAATAQKKLLDLGFTNITFKVGDGSVGVAEHAPYDCILVTAGAPVVPENLKLQLAIGGTLVIPVGGTVSQELKRIKRISEDTFSEEKLEGVRFVPLIGEEGWRK
ncbi:MAG: protein-L-isoaspartate(D-aspartate) O-methyltransferase [Parachlamydiales bacterium]|jgi:protein-L-isoaspartate(D-aspartate) O-methyltransferase